MSSAELDAIVKVWMGPQRLQGRQTQRQDVVGNAFIGSDGAPGGEPKGSIHKSVGKADRARSGELATGGTRRRNRRASLFRLQQANSANGKAARTRATCEGGREGCKAPTEEAWALLETGERRWWMRRASVPALCRRADARSLAPARQQH